MSLHAALVLIGGIGLLLLGMRLMTDGLRLAAGRALEGILANWTRTPLRGIGTGALITAVVQSSSVVTVAPWALSTRACSVWSAPSRSPTAAISAPP